MCEQVAREILFLVLEILWDDSVFCFSKKTIDIYGLLGKLNLSFHFRVLRLSLHPNKRNPTCEEIFLGCVKKNG